ncbi:MAG: diguanylate cyclase [Sulfuricurvum sp.]|nr:diguanylate cyclase [Sulfuricurvum sp.]
MDKPKILVIDDEPANIKLVAYSLQSRYKILVALNGAVAIEILKNESCDLILLDVHMPEMNGFEVLKWIKNNVRTAHIPVIFLTGDTSEQTIVDAFNAGAVDYITKPFQLQEMNSRVDNHVRSHTLQKNLQKALKRNTQLLDIIDSYVSFVKVDTEGVIQEISSNFCRFLQCTRDHLIGQNIRILKSGRTPPAQYEELWNTISSGKSFIHEIEDRNFRGGTNWYQVSISPNYDENNHLVDYIAFYENIDEKMRFKKNAETDSLTALPNRFKLDEILMQEERRANRYQHDFSIILVDIDHFKEVNDQYGHQIGDIVLQEFAEVLSENIRKSDFIGRWGGEEFLIVCPHTDQAGAYALAEHLRVAVERRLFSKSGQKTASFGVAEYQKGKTLESLFKGVDDALYAAKASGRNQVKIGKAF